MPFTTLSAKPSAIAVFPTPGSPTNKGLFFVLLHKTWIVLSSSDCLPIKGSTLPSAAFSFRFTAYLSRAFSDFLLSASSMSLSATDGLLDFE